MIRAGQHLVLVGMMGVGKSTVARVLADRLGRAVYDTDHVIEAQTGRKVELDGRVDDSVVGGIVLQVGNRVLDASIRGNLDRLRREVASAH